MNRKLVAVLLLVALALPLAARGQAAETLPRVVVLGEFTTGATVEIVEGLRQTMRELGWVEGRTFAVDVRYASSLDQWPRIVAEVEQLKPSVIVSCAPCSFRIAPTGVTPIRDIPIVFVAVSDPIAAKMVDSLAKPGGNMTGVSYLGVELNVKRLQLLKEALPNVARVGVLVLRDHPLRDRMVRELEEGARALNVKLLIVDVPSVREPPFDEAFQTLAAQGAEAVIALQGPPFNRERAKMAKLALHHRLALVHEFAGSAEAGALLTYSPSATELTRVAVGYVDKILKGARPADLPVQQPTKVELVINLRTARALGVTMPPALVGRADRVIE